MNKNKKRGFALIEMLVVIVIIAILAVILIPKYTGINAVGKDKINAPVQRAHGVECQNNLQQIRNAITLYYTQNEQYPATLDALSSSMSSTSFKCPVSGNPYIYDPGAGKVSCSTPGHEKF
ncbi:MAG: prepilin-type N-terminal cleavage/methylation domain-containing protein [Armatimonadota bacterium]